MSYSDAIEYLYGLQKFGIKLGLEKTGTILSILGDPYKSLRFIHVAGTNGKGSVSSMLTSVLMAHGYKVGLFTSPHLVSFTERIRINNKQISEPEVIALTDEIKIKLQKSDRKPAAEPTFFEFVTAMAFLYFSRNMVDWIVMEVGMGGRLDATNVIIPKVSVITKIGLDHSEFLGSTLQEIAYEKAGIIKVGVPVVSAMQEKEAADVICNAALEKAAPLYIYGRDFLGDLKSADINGITFEYIENNPSPDHDTNHQSLFVPLAGEHQVLNACLAIKAAMIALTKNSTEGKQSISEPSDLPRFRSSALREGLASTRWPGRLEIISSDPLIIIDGAHNPDAANALAGFLHKYLFNYNIILIMGIMSDKDIRGILGPLLPLSSEIIFTAPNYGRAALPQKLAEYAAAMGFADVHTSPDITSAIDKAKGLYSSLIAHNPSLILITGSFYTIGEAKELLGEKAVLGDLRETL